MYDGIIQFSFTQYTGVITKKPTKVGTKKANRNKVFEEGSLNLNSALLMYLYVKAIKERDKIGSNKRSWCAIAPKKKFGEISSFEILPVLLDP